MATATPATPATIDKDALKKAIIEVLSENRELFKDVIVELFEDHAMAEAIRQGMDSPIVSHDEGMKILEALCEDRVPKRLLPRLKKVKKPGPRPRRPTGRRPG